MKKIIIHKTLNILPVLVCFLLLSVSTDAYAFSLDTFNPFHWGKEALGAVGNLIKSGSEFIGDLAEDAIDFGADLLGLGGKDCSVPIFENSSNCLFCPIFEVLFDASAAVAGTSYRAFKSDLGQIVLIFMAVVIALNLLKNLASMGARDTRTILNDIFSRAFVCAAIYIIITRDYYNMMNMIIVPILEDGMSFIGFTGGSCQNVAEISGFIKGVGAGMTTGDFQYGETIPYKIGSLIITSICNIEQKIQVLFDYGDWAWCLGTGPERIIFHVLPNPIYLIDGLLLYLGGIFFMVAYPWVLADAVLQLGIALAFLPFAVVGYAFGQTKKYLPKLFSWILNSLFVFVFMSILLTCIIDYIARLLGLIFDVGDYSTMFTDPNLGVAFYGPNMIKILFILVIGWTYMPAIRDLAGNFAEGSGLSAAQKTGEAFVTNPVEHYAGKAGEAALTAAGNTALSAVSTTGRLTRGANRNIALALTKTFGATDAATGNKTVKIAGRTFTAEKNADGKTVLKREHTSFSGRQHTTVYDKYTTIHQVRDRNGNLISSQVEFKHNFAKKYLFNEKGEVNIGAMKKLLEESRLGKDPAYRQAIMEQIAVEAAKRKGFNVGSYFNQRRVIYDPNNPHKISIEQIDHSGSVTKISLDVDERTGQTAFGFSQDIASTSPFQKVERKAKIKMHKLFMGQEGHYTAAGNLAFTTWLGTDYEMRNDAATGEEYYIRGRKKYWLFGPYEIKEFHADGTVRRVQKSAQAQAKHANEATKIATILNGATERKTLFHTYGSYVDANGNTVYTKKLRAGWNIKNYLRVPKRTVTYLAKTTAKVAFTSIQAPLFAITHPQRATRNLLHFRSFLGSVGQGYASDWTKYFGDAVQTGDSKHYTPTQTVVTDAYTGQTASVSFNDYTIATDVNGSKIVRDNLTGETQDASKPRKHSRFVYFNNGVVEIKTSGEVDEKGNILKEETKFKYSDAAQYGHDSIVSEDDTYQIVNEQGNISDRLQAVLRDGSANPLNLTFGLDNIGGTTVIGGQPTTDFVVNNILRVGRKRRTNKMKTKFLNSI